jgi:hypothetical protein
MSAPREDTTTFTDGRCARCGWPRYSQDEHGVACERCGRRVTWPTSTTLEGRCRDCRYWNGVGAMAAYCFKIKGQNGRWCEIPDGRAAFYADQIDANGPYLMTRPDFGCTLFEPGRPRFWGDDGN